MRTLWILVAVLAFLSQEAHAQVNRPDPYATRILLGSESYTWESVRDPAPRVASRAPARSVASAPAPPPVALGTQRVLNYYGGMQARMALSQMPARPSNMSASSQDANRPLAKPFNTVVSSPTVSPYLNLHREELGEAAPNYHAFVRPMQQQIEANHYQAQRLQQLERNLRQATPTSRTSYGGAARYGDTGQYYRRWR